MQILRDIIKDLIFEAISASSEYMKKEVVRQSIQDLIKQKVKSGEISNQQELDDWMQSASMAIMALKMVPVEAYVEKKKLIKKR
jgi:hypothetical protein